ncbi:hypothetical protein H6P81_020840 [Aristolochia fimbriata]|uniref:Uncharacterized protein n=1 Tax=Aristolochia fimbriata TaxID=158543 RepID=A0AAV7DVJ6_ARIFI|nr:hypothetical protein H6P81_020840 [Aristolochia fimbriata]
MEAVQAASAKPPPFSYQIDRPHGGRFPAIWRCPKFLGPQARGLHLRCHAGVLNDKPYEELPKLKLGLKDLAGRLWISCPESMKEFPWKKAEEVVLDDLIDLGKRVLKGAIVVFFILSSLSDIIFSISTNKELMVPLGLFVGCTMAEFLKEASAEFFQNMEEGGLLWRLIAIGTFFMLVKFVSQNLTIQGNALLSNTGNGGLMQVLWLGKKYLFQQDNNQSDGHPTLSETDASSVSQ